MEKNIIKEIDKYNDKYQFIFEFSGSNKNIGYVIKNGVDLFDTGHCHTPEVK